MQIASASSSQALWHWRITVGNSSRAGHRAMAPQRSKSEETLMRSLIILSIVVLLKIEQELTRSRGKRAVPRRHRPGALRE
jgi:hypothetical protein